jgi:cell volume regulation protein A
LDLANQLIFVAALLFLASILASAGAARIGAPLLLVFLVLGMLAGEDGPGGIRFDDYRATYIVGSIALAVILFDGGLRTDLASSRAGVRPALALATLGVVITAGLTGAFAAWALGLDPMQGLLIGAIVGSTDAAAVFALLHSHGMQLKRRVAATLEIESGSNDPMAIFLTIVLVDLLARGASPSWSLAWMFLQQMGLGLALGLTGGRAIAWLVNRLVLAPGLYPLLALAGGLFVFAGTAMLGGSGFLAIYVAGLVLGNRRLHSANDILRVHDGIAWIGQITMFLVLGLLVTPSELIKLAPAALGIAAVLMLVARPLAVWLSLLPFRFPRGETLFICWVGLRGAVPVVLALFPLMAGLEQARLYFNVAFFVVLISLTVQGWTVAPLARRLRLELPPTANPVQRIELELAHASGEELVAFRVSAGSRAAGSRLESLPLPKSARIAGVVRAGALRDPARVQALLPGDAVYAFMRGADIAEFGHAFTAEPQAGRLRERAYFGDFVLDARARLSDVCAIYGVAPPAGLEDATLREAMSARFKGRPVVGDRVDLGEIELVVRELSGAQVSRVGLVITRRPAPPAGGATRKA